MPQTPISSLDYPAGTDAPAGPLQIQQLATDLDSKLGMGFYRTRTATLAVTGSNTAIAAWPTLVYSSGNFGTYTASGVNAGQFTFAVAGLYRWTVCVSWPNSNAYKARAALLVNGAFSVNGDNISDWPVTISGATPNYVHFGEMPVAVGDVWQIALASSMNVTVTPQSYSVVKIA